MKTPAEPVGFPELSRAVAGGDMAAIRTALSRIDDEEAELLAQRIGVVRVERLRRVVRRGRETQRRASRGRVIVIHGIMGAQLDVVEPDGDADRVWLNYLRLLNGRIADLELVDGTRPKDPSLNVQVAGIFPEYLPLLVELDQFWKVTPFAFDWRLDIDVSAGQLATFIQSWTAGEPCHIVAHSMGGLVARRMTQLFPAVWASMADPDGRKRGGRLIQLGTPNRGSFAIPLMLTGQEPIVKKLAMLDRKHDLKELLPILATFPGSYQMMPAPASGPDDRDRLYNRGTWGSTPPIERYLEAGRRFHKALETVVTPDAIVYVAGYDQDTPYRIRVTKPGEFQYQVTRKGDGRVPHDLGLLDQVHTLWVREIHGDLAGNDSVLTGIHELLRTGNTLDLESTMGAVRGRAPTGWQTQPVSWEQEVDAFAAILPRDARSRRVRGVGQEVESALLSGFVGLPPVREGAEAADVAPSPAAAARGTKRRSTPVNLAVQVICGDITRVRADVYAVGHYVGVLPQAAEGALDRVVSSKNAPRDEHVLRTHTLLGLLRGELGEVNRYPWADRSGRLVAVAGMGFPGTFGASELRVLANKLALNVMALPNVKTIATVLIGSGAGNLAVSTCVRQLLRGVADALRYGAKRASNVATLKIVERDLAKAHEIRDLVERFATDPDGAETLRIRSTKQVQVHSSAHGTRQFVVPGAVAALIAASGAQPNTRVRRAADDLLRALPGDLRTNRAALQQFADLAGGAPTYAHLAGRVTVAIRDRVTGDHDAQASTRFSIVREGSEFIAAALADTAVVPQRVLRFDLKLFEELVVKATDPPAEEAADLGLLSARLLVPNDFLPLLLRGGSLVAELDRYSAALPWELLAIRDGIDGPSRHLALNKPFARQLRTAYSGAPSIGVDAPRDLRALVIGDPGDPRVGDDLPGARREAIEVARFLQSKGVVVEARIGAPAAGLRGYKAASRLEVLKLLLSGSFDFVHYCGHGDFAPDRPDTTGWVFEDGLLTAREIEGIQRPPRLILANACLSGRLSERRDRGSRITKTARDAELLPTLADEFFKRGVRDYIGTAWEVNDEGAIAFAKRFYGEIFDQRATFGEAMLAARQDLEKKCDLYDALWAAYQHYGDPGATFGHHRTANRARVPRGLKRGRQTRS